MIHSSLNYNVEMRTHLLKENKIHLKKACRQARQDEYAISLEQKKTSKAELTKKKQVYHENRLV